MTVFGIRFERFVVATILTLATAHSASAAIGEIDVNAGPAPTPADTAPQDKSTLWVHSGTRASLLLTDAKGRRTGVDPKTFKTLEEIPNSTCETEFIENRYTGDAHAEVNERITLEPAPKGIYGLTFSGLQPGPVTLTIAGLNKEGSSIPEKDLDTMISEGQEKPFKLSFDPSPGNQAMMLETAQASK